MTSRWIFAGFVALIAAQRLVELRVSRRHEQELRASGGIEYGAGHYPVMVGLHTAWLVSMVGEVFVFNRPFLAGLFVPALALFLAGQALRYSAILTLGSRWTVRVLVLPGKPLIRDGIYRYFRHPNYLGVALEILTAPLLHSAYLTALVFSLANAVFLNHRIRVEEAAFLKIPINAHSQ
jgi:methyltransferase